MPDTSGQRPAGAMARSSCTQGIAMKVTLDLDQLLKEEKITQTEYEKLGKLAKSSIGSLAFNLLIGFGVISVSVPVFAIVPSAVTAIVIGLILLLSGLQLSRGGSEKWSVLSGILILVGALMTGGGIVTNLKGSLFSLLLVTALFAMAGYFARSALLAVLATLMLSSCLGASTGYFHASYFLVIQEPASTILLFTTLAIGLYLWSRKIPFEYERVALASARTSVFLVNFGFWVGSLWGDRLGTENIIITDHFFSILWAMALLAMAFWSWKRNNRWVLNTVATFAGIHFYTQWFETLGATPGAVILAGMLALGFAIGLRSINSSMSATA